MEDYLKDKILFIFSLICKVFKYFLCKPFTWLYEIYVIIKRKYITTPKIKNRIINDLEYNCKKTNVLLKLKEGLETIKKGKFVIIEHRGYIPRRESSFGIDVMTTLYVYNLSIKINQQNFLEYTNNQYEYNITVGIMTSRGQIRH